METGEWSGKMVKCTYQLPAARGNPALNQGNGASMGKILSPTYFAGRKAKAMQSLTGHNKNLHTEIG